MRRLRIVLGIMLAGALVAILALARLMGAHWNLLFLLAMVALPVRLIGLIRDIRAERIRWPRRWSADERAGHILHALVQSLGVLVGALAIHTAIIPAQLGPDLMLTIVVLVGLALGWVTMAWLPRSTPRWGLSTMMLWIGLLFGHDLVRTAAVPEPQVSGLHNPLAADAVVMHGGSTPLINHHASISQQHHALDLIVTRNGLFTDGPMESVESYGCWGTAVRAPAAGVVVRAVSDLPDNPIGEMDTENLAGNLLVIELGPERFILLAHLQADSLAVQVGDRVDAGQHVARCGNSGNTSAPHLHVQLMNKPDFSNDDPDLYTIPAAYGAVGRDGETAERVPRRNDIFYAAP